VSRRTELDRIRLIDITRRQLLLYFYPLGIHEVDQLWDRHDRSRKYREEHDEAARIVTGEVATTVLDDTDFGQYKNPMYLRFTKAGSAYVALYSVDGANWTQATSFTDTTAFTSIGPFASNYNSTPANATPVVMSVNWFAVQYWVRTRPPPRIAPLREA
jgi:hypothetical protein